MMTAKSEFLVMAFAFAFAALPLISARVEASSPMKASVRDDAHVNPSLTLVVPNGRSAAPRRFDSSTVKQYAPSPLSGSTNHPRHDGGASYAPRFIPPPRLWGNAPESAQPFARQGSVWGDGPSWGNGYHSRPGMGGGSYYVAPKWNYSITPRNGIMTWQPGYQTKATRMSYATTSATYRRKDYLAIAAGRAGSVGNSAYGTLKSTRGAVSAAPNVVALQAQQYKLPENAKNHKTAANWDEWYKQIAKSVYEVWTQNEVVVGGTTLQVEVWPGLELDCKVVEFTPPSDVKRDAKLETEFREAALRSMRSMKGSSALEFPACKPVPKSVIFDMEFKREVDGPAGCKVVHQRAVGL